MSKKSKQFSDFIKLPRRYSAVSIAPESFGRTGYVTHSSRIKGADFIFIFDDNEDRGFAIFKSKLICHDLNINNHLAINPKYANNRATPIKH